jgi:hypothetical protein
MSAAETSRTTCSKIHQRVRAGPQGPANRMRRVKSSSLVANAKQARTRGLWPAFLCAVRDLNPEPADSETVVVVSRG